MHDSSNATAVESQEEIAIESRFLWPLERVVQARGRETMPLRFRDNYGYRGGEIDPWGSCVPWLTPGFHNAAKRPGAAGQVDSKAL
eukprot:24315-Prymnesium_polylepis.1